MDNNNSNEIIMAESDEVVVVSASKLNMPMMKTLCKSSDYEELKMKIVVGSTIMSAVFHEHHPQVDTPANPWVT